MRIVVPHAPELSQAGNANDTTREYPENTVERSQPSAETGLRYDRHLVLNLRLIRMCVDSELEQKPYVAERGDHHPVSSATKPK